MPPKKAAGDAATAGKNDPEEVLLDVCGDSQLPHPLSPFVDVRNTRLMLTVSTFHASSVDSIARSAFYSCTRSCSHHTQYLNKQNRPYNATDLQANLKAKFNISKPAVVKALASLAQKGEIVEKTYGKQVIYAAKQPEEATSGEDMEKLRADLAEKKIKLKELNDAQKDLTARKWM